MVPRWLGRPKDGIENAMPLSQNYLEVLTDPQDANIDIVAVHGLNPFNRPAHAESTWTAEGDLWLRDRLGYKAHNARVMLFGYNSNVAFGTASSGVREHAETLLNRLAAERAIFSSRPLIFICHSLGGLVVKRAMVSAKSDERYGLIWKSTFGIIFFGTPHRGGNKSGIGGLAATIARGILGSPNNGLMKALQAQSDVLNTITDDFRRCLEDFEFISFFETKNLWPLRHLIVEPESATLGLAPERELQLGLDADHSHICKFTSKDDHIYQQVEVNILNLIKKAVTTSQVPLQKNVLGHEANSTSTNGEFNRTTQVGNANDSKIHGDGNSINQFGDANKSNTDGKQNMVTQVVMEPEQALAFARDFFLKKLTSTDTSPGQLTEKS